MFQKLLQNVKWRIDNYVDFLGCWLSTKSISSQPYLDMGTIQKLLSLFSPLPIFLYFVITQKQKTFHDLSPVYQSSNLVGTLRLIDSIGLRVERPYSPSSRRIPWHFSRSLAHTHADTYPTMPNMCTGAFYVLHRLNNSCAIYAIYTVVLYDSFILNSLTSFL